jgi:hypothetical protein
LIGTAVVVILIIFAALIYSAWWAGNSNHQLEQLAKQLGIKGETDE